MRATTSVRRTSRSNGEGTKPPWVCFAGRRNGLDGHTAAPLQGLPNPPLEKPQPFAWTLYADFDERFANSRRQAGVRRVEAARRHSWRRGARGAAALLEATKTNSTARARGPACA